MRRRLLACLVSAAFSLLPGLCSAQSSIQTLRDELNEAKTNHDEVTTKTLTTFFASIDAAMADPDAALTLYKKSRGPMPDPVPVASLLHDSETATETQEREALDQANLTRLSTALQLHCGLMHYAALFALKPDQRGLQAQWVAWLTSAAKIYPQLALPPLPPEPPPDMTPKSERKKHVDAPAPATIQRPPPFYPEDLKGKPVRDSVIAKYLGFHAWDEKDSGGWSIRDIPQLYRRDVLEPSRKPPTAETLGYWDVYIGMANADERDNNRWDDVVYPPLQFDRTVDAYLVTPGTEKLEALVNVIKANPNYPKVDDWIKRVGALMDDYGKAHGAPPARTQASTSSTSDTSGDSGVSVTTETQGDMTIVTTHTNSAATNAPPQAPQPSTRPAMGVAPVMDMQSVMDAAPVIRPRNATNAAPVTPQ